MNDYKDSDFINKTGIYDKYMVFPKGEYRHIFINIEYIALLLYEGKFDDLDLTKIETEYRNTRKLFLIAINLTYVASLDYGSDHVEMSIDYEYNKVLMYDNIDEANFTELFIAKYVLNCYASRRFFDIALLGSRLHPYPEFSSFEECELFNERLSPKDKLFYNAIGGLHNLEQRYGTHSYQATSVPVDRIEVPIYVKSDN